MTSHLLCSVVFDRLRSFLLKRSAVPIGLLILMAMTLAWTVVAAPPPFSQMWKGKEMWQFGGGKYTGPQKSWKDMPGSLLRFNYSGKGPLPAPIDLVIPLEKPLPLGAYRLFVKNSSYLGKMEATVGDITHPLMIRRFDWTPGTTFEVNEPVDKITLRYYPNRIVADTGAEQNQKYIVQGVFLTTERDKVPVRGGEIVTSVPNETPARKDGNYLANASFECGVFPWGKPYGVSGVDDAANLDNTTAVDGKTSLKIQAGKNFGLESPLCRLAPGDYTLSFYAKAEKPVELNVAVEGLTEDLKNYANAGLNKRFKLTPQWQRYSLKGQVKLLPGSLYTVRFVGRNQPLAAVWFDGLQLENGQLHDFRPAAVREVGYVCNVPGNIFYEGQGSDIDLIVSDSSGAKQDTVNYRVVDYWGQEMEKGTKTVTIDGKLGKVPVPVYAAKRGLFRATFTLDRSTNEMVYSVLPVNTHLKSFYPQGSLGVDSSFGAEGLAILKRANFNWVISKMLGRWNAHEIEKGQYQFDEAAAPAADHAKISVMVQPCLTMAGRPQWLKDLAKPRGGAEWKAENRQKYMDDWAAFIGVLAEKYKGSVHDWEIENEPNYTYSGAEYGEILKRASAEIRRVDPKATIAGFSGGGFNEKFYRDGIAVAGPSAFDVMSVHFYGNQTDRMRDFAELVKQEHKAAWNTETGATCPTFFKSLQVFESMQQPDYWRIADIEMHRLTVHAVQNYLLSRSVAGMERYFYYFQRFANASPSQPTASFGNGKELAEFDGSLRGSGVGLSIASHFLDEAKYRGPVELDNRIEMHVFDKGDGTVGFCFAKDQSTLMLDVGRASDVSFYDIMGNKIAAAKIALAESPIYFTCSTSATDVVGILKSIAVSAKAD